MIDGLSGEKKSNKRVV